MSEDLQDFESFPDDIRQGIRELGWSQPMPVQSRVIPLMRQGRDLIVQALTGSGKTGAFGLPIVEQLDPQRRGIQVLILAPTRELASQIEQEISIMGRARGIESMAVYGGTAYGPQLDALQRGVPVIVGTPGRILDHLGSGTMKLGALKVLIFDEADELLSLGFWPDMREIQKYVPKKRQTGLFSATMPARVRSLSRVFLHEPEFISLTEGGVRSPEEIEHYHYIVPAQQKDAILLNFLKYEDPDSAIIFCNTRADVRFVCAFLQRNHLDVDMIQGEMTQVAREAVMKRIKAGELRFLVATDVAARGIDISDLSHVISYSTPDQAELYLHRTGRTGRAGKTGTAVSLVSGLDIGNFRNLQAVNQLTIPERKIPSEAVVAEHVAQRLEVQLEHDLRHLSERERQARGEELLPVVEQLIRSEEGRRHLAAILFSYIHERRRPAPGSREKPDAGADPAPADETAGKPGGRPRRRRRRR
ncbi:MAG: DEAD/DEAH box helicase [Myxococcales bacterium]|nr:DEAD/DEAH box helicase [Myxococcales bacterium]